MTRDEWQQVKAIAGEALGLPDGEREHLVADRCASDGNLEREVRSLVAAAIVAADRFEDSLPVPPGALSALTDELWPAALAAGARVGPYRIVSEIGRGGMGAAYLAERADQSFTRRVAVKVIKRGMDTDAIVRRFLHERQILADLNHPNIAMLLDGGTTDDGRPYFVMEYVEGLPIDVYCDEGRLSIQARLELVRLVCEAVHHAHQQRVIHRDLKPNNILVAPPGVPKLLDFGIAKLLHIGSDSQTGDGTLLAQAMTPQYASPEQVRGEAVSPASDVYSLGVLVYELLAGRYPYILTGKTRTEAEHLVCDVMPPPPSQAVDAAAAPRRSQTIAALRRQIRGNIDAIVMMALEKAPSKRYPSAKAFADDIERHLGGRPIVARMSWGALLSPSVRTPVARRLLLLVATLVALAVGALAITQWRNGSSQVRPLDSVAVLPLAIEGDTGGSLDYIADGLVEDLINRLSMAPRMKVIARESVYRYKGRGRDLRAIGRDLQVDAVLVGRLVHRSPGMTLSLALVDTRDERQLWGAQYTRPQADLQVLSADVSQLVAKAMRIQLPLERREPQRPDGRRSPEAYELYLKGRYFWNRRTIVDLEKGIEYFRQALEREADFVMAHVGLADSLSLLTEYHGAPAAETYQAAAQAAARALELDATSAEAHASLAYIRQFYEWDFQGAEREFRRAIELNPNYATAHQWYAEFLSAMGRHDEALLEIRQAARLDPLSLIVKAVEANLLYMGRRYDEAIAQAMTAIDMDPNFPETYEYLKRSLDQKQLYSEAIQARQTRRRLVRRDVTETGALRAAAAATDPRTYWRMRLQQELIEGREEGLQAFEMAEIYAQAGDSRRSLDWLEKACHEQHDFMTMYARVAPNLDPIRADPRYAAILARTCRV